MSQDNSDLNERRYRRIELKMGMRISTIDPETDPATGRPYFRTSEETCGNVSRGGAYVETEEAVSPGRRLLVELDLPGGDRIQTIGRVAWTKAALAPSEARVRTAMGIEFVAGSVDELRPLENLLDAAKEAEESARDDKAFFVR